MQRRIAILGTSGAVGSALAMHVLHARLLRLETSCSWLAMAWSRPSACCPVLLSLQVDQRQAQRPMRTVLQPSPSSRCCSPLFPFLKCSYEISVTGRRNDVVQPQVLNDLSVMAGRVD